MAERLRASARNDIDPAASTLLGDPLLKLLTWVPLMGDQVTAALDLVQTARVGATSLTDVIQVANAYQASSSDTGPPGPRLLKLIGTSAEPLGRVHAELGPTVAALKRDQQRRLLPPLRARVSEALGDLAPADAAAASGALAGRYAPAALGADGTRTYLVLMANPSELRPAGGFAGSVGTVTFEQGAPGAVDIKSQDVFNPLFKQRFPLPDPIGRYLRFYNNALELGDAGWDPDFPSTAKLSEAMYLSATGKAVDGTISVDPYAIAALLKLAGPVDVPGYGSFSGDDFFARLNFIVNVSHAPGSGKAALSPITQAVLKLILSQPVNRWPKLLTIFQDQARSRHIQLALHDPQLSAAAAGVNYNGAALSTPDDYLMVVDANVGATKGDYFVKKHLDVKAEVPDNGLGRHEVVVTYEMPNPVDDTDRALNPGDGAYKDYVRFYLPETSSLTDLRITEDGKPAGGAPERVVQERGKTVVATFIAVRRGHKVSVRLDYDVAARGNGAFELYIQKQAGQLSRPTVVEVSYPGNRKRVTTDLTEDAVVRLTW